MANGPKRRPTTTSNFGVGRRESHDASGFYGRFAAPEVSSDDTVAAAPAADQIWVHDARQMPELPDASVALVVTSPPYFAGKAYEEALGEGHIPADYVEYLDMLTEVFAECARVLEPGGRIAVNVANLGRKPYRSLSADVIGILQDRLGLLLRGEVIWQKARGAGGNCAWGSFQSARNPVLRDITERIVVASKGRFDRARTSAQRGDEGLPTESSIGKDEFLDLTLDLWEFPPESATRVGHPAPFPVELPRRLIELYTFKGDLVLDPFMGSGSTGVAAVRTGRRFAGYDTDHDYAESARERVRGERVDLDLEHARLKEQAFPPIFQTLKGLRAQAGAEAANFQKRARDDGMRAQAMAQELLEHCGFAIDRPRRSATGVEVNFAGVGREDADKAEWLIDVSGAFGSSRPGLQRTDTLWKALGKAAVLRAELRDHDRPLRYLLLTTDVPPRRSAGGRALEAALADGLVWDVLLLEQPESVAALVHYASGDRPDRPATLTAYAG